MPIPPLNEHGYLPGGVHDCTLEEVEERFARFQQSDRRIRLFETLREYVRQVSLTGLGVALIIDASFVTAKPEPEDIDLLLILKRDHNYQAQLRPFEYNTITKAGVRRQYRLDLFAYCEGTRELRRLMQLFQRVREDEDGRKGILRIQL